eukprot:5723877-Pleurochrysis_carterae.AAC.5
MTTSCNNNSQWSGSERGRKGWAHLQGCSGSAALKRGLPWALRAHQNSESGARALRKYACDANASWETVHAIRDYRIAKKRRARQ